MSKTKSLPSVGLGKHVSWEYGNFLMDSVVGQINTVLFPGLTYARKYTTTVAHHHIASVFSIIGDEIIRGLGYFLNVVVATWLFPVACGEQCHEKDQGLLKFICFPISFRTSIHVDKNYFRDGVHGFCSLSTWLSSGVPENNLILKVSGSQAHEYRFCQEIIIARGFGRVGATKAHNPEACYRSVVQGWWWDQDCSEACHCKRVRACWCGQSAQP